MKTPIYILTSWKVEKTMAGVDGDIAKRFDWWGYSKFKRWIDFAETEEEAKEMWENWRKEKIQKLQKQINKLEKRKFTDSLI